jgi:hypothetical protein
MPSTSSGLEEDEDRRSNYSVSNPGFEVELPFDLTIGFAGKSVTRKARVVFEHTPEWEYWHLGNKALYTGWGSTSYHLEVAAVADNKDEDGNEMEGVPYWRRLEEHTRDDIVPTRMCDPLLDAVDAHCRAEDARRRKIAAASKMPSPKGFLGGERECEFRA